MAFMMSGGRMSMGGKPMPMMSKQQAAALAQQRREQFSFPVLSVEEIVACLAELGIHTDEDDLVKARPDHVRNIYEQLLHICMDVSREELYQPKFAGLEYLKFEELHEESVPVVHFLRSMTKLLHASLVHEGYTLRDLMKPDPTRVRRNISAIINFHKYREEKLAMHKEHRGKTHDLLKLKEQLEAEQLELTRQIEADKTQRAREEPEVAALRQQIATLTHEKETCEAAVGRVSAVLHEQRETAQALREAMNVADLKLENLRQETSVRRNQVVASPQRIKAEVENVGRQVEEAKHNVAAADAERRSMVRRVEVLAKADKDVRKALTLLAELEAEILKLKKAARDSKTKQGEAEALRQEVEDLRGQMDHLEKTVKRTEERLMDVRSNRSVKEEAASRQTSVIRQEVAAVMEEAAAARESRRLAEQRKVGMEAERDRAVARHAAEMSDMMAGIRSLQKIVSEYHARLFKSVAEASAEPWTSRPAPSFGAGAGAYATSAAGGGAGVGAGGALAAVPGVYASEASAAHAAAGVSAAAPASPAADASGAFGASSFYGASSAAFSRHAHSYMGDGNDDDSYAGAPGSPSL